MSVRIPILSDRTEGYLLVGILLGFMLVSDEIRDGIKNGILNIYERFFDRFLADSFDRTIGKYFADEEETDEPDIPHLTLVAPEDNEDEK